MFHFAAIARCIATLIALFFASVTLGADNLLLNPGAEQGKRENPSVWGQASIAADGLRMERTTTNPKSGEASLMISNDHEYDKPVANNWMQSLQKVPQGAVLRIAAAIRTQDADSANVCLQCWDVTGEKMLAFASTPVIRGDQDWIRVTSDPVVVPAETASIIVRAALAGKGKAWFDDLEVTSERQSAAERVASVPPNGASSDADKDAEPDLPQKLPGRLIERVPVSKDCMILAYMPEWKYGLVDNIGVENHDGGVRTLFAWKPLPPESIDGPNRRVYLAVYSRKTTGGPDAPEITISPIAQDWPETTSWQTQPKSDPAVEPVTAKFEPGKGWKLFDITSLIRKNKTATQHGVVLKFKDESLSTDKQGWSGYELVSREGLGEWAHRHAQLLIIESATPNDDGAGKK